MTSVPVSLTSLDNILTSASADIAIIKDTKTTFRLVLAFSFFLNQDVNVNWDDNEGNQLVQKFTSAVEEAWKDEIACMWHKFFFK